MLVLYMSRCALLHSFTTHLFTLGEQRDLEQPFCSLVQKMGVQHSDFTEITQPDLGRRLPKAFSNLDTDTCTHEHTQNIKNVNSKGSTKDNITVTLVDALSSFKKQ